MLVRFELMLTSDLTLYDTVVKETLNGPEGLPNGQIPRTMSLAIPPSPICI